MILLHHVTRVAISAGLIALAQSSARALELPCGGEEHPCVVDSGSYHLAAPEDWDGITPIPAMVFFHGWRRSGVLVLRNAHLVDTVTSRGMLLIAPNGADRTWAHVGSPSDARDDLAFIEQVLDDVAARLPIDDDRLYASGFSQGGSMAWDVACYMGDRFAAVLPVAGAFWRPLPETCDGPVTMRHVHGTTDTVVPMTGRPIGDAWHQGDVLLGSEIMRSAGACPADADDSYASGRLQCRTWTGCDGATTFELCLHGGGHDFDPAWIGEGLDWAAERG